MITLDFEKNYILNILPLFDIEYPEGIEFCDTLPKECYSLPTVNLKHLDIYSIDPEGCTDADDAFSLFKDDDGRIYLIIHIANPTEYIKLHSTIFSRATQLITTRYPEGKSPLSLFPKKIEEMCTLQPNETEDAERSAISVRYLVDPDTLELTFNDMFMSVVKPKIQHMFTYKNAGRLFQNNNRKGREIKQIVGNLEQRSVSNKEMGNTLVLAYNISEKLRKDGNRNLASYDRTFVRDDKRIVLACEYEGTIKMKSMIEQFAIHTNNTISKELSSKKLCSLFRKQSEADHLAEFTISCDKHTKLNLDCYSHFTSPLRRVVDCYLHYDIRRYLFNKVYKKYADNGVEEKQLIMLMNRINEMSKYMRTLDNFNKKYKMIQYLYENNNNCLYGYVSRPNRKIKLKVTGIIDSKNDMFRILPIQLTFTDDPGIPPTIIENYCEKHPSEEAKDEVICCLESGFINELPQINRTPNKWKIFLDVDDNVLPGMYQDLINLLKTHPRKPMMKETKKKILQQVRKPKIRLRTRTKMKQMMSAAYREVPDPEVVYGKDHEGKPTVEYKPKYIQVMNKYGNLELKPRTKQIVEQVPAQDKFGRPIFEPDLDEYGRPRIEYELDQFGNLQYELDQFGNPQYELDEYGKIKFEYSLIESFTTEYDQERDEMGNLKWHD